ncbi:uncharacterized protein LY89DRAFT_227217 [Mollisia scopiformis]|uniref:Uncharacterized protein n=1 Tax=Mollisia scopiformis TaxID=149040 RepID=A0A194WUC1_MOLSC|nr:uncharacterized protein LY89DRAFT_227217 [Mollisia scopiformis]KUJ11558.1 hypothetical protein LY89DRAFT_227217 [Mollisia scopiformis]
MHEWHFSSSNTPIPTLPDCQETNSHKPLGTISPLVLLCLLPHSRESLSWSAEVEMPFSHRDFSTPLFRNFEIVQLSTSLQLFRRKTTDSFLILRTLVQRI